MKNPIQSLLAVALCVAGLPFAAAQTIPAPLLEYTFEDTGTTSANTGTLGSAGDLTFYNAVGITTTPRTGTPADLHSAPGTGVGGIGRAFDNTASTDMGSLNAATGNRAQTDSSVSASLAGLQSFTITGWFKTDGDTGLGSGAKIFEMTTTTVNSGITLSSPSSGKLNLYVNGTTGPVGSDAVYTATQSWVFFAVTYDGTSSSNNVAFYIGSETGAVSLAGTATLDKGSVVSSGTGLALGNSVGSNSRPFDGLLDDISLFGSTEGAGGVLDLAQLEAVRSSAIPEPSAVALLAGAAALGLVIVRRRRAIGT